MMLYDSAEDHLMAASEHLIIALKKISDTLDRRQADPEEARRWAPLQHCKNLMDAENLVEATLQRVNDEINEVSEYVAQRMRDFGGNPTTEEACPEVFEWGLLSRDTMILRAPDRGTDGAP